jgi:hypothetical protein
MYIFDTNRALQPTEIDALLRRALKLAMLRHGITEEALAEELSKQPGFSVSPAQVTAWKAETRKRWRLPAALVPILSQILGDDSIQRLLLSEKLKQSLDLGESAPRIVSLLRSALSRKVRRKRTRKA